LKQAKALWPFFSNFFLRIGYQEESVKSVHFKFDGTQVLGYDDDITVLREIMYSRTLDCEQLGLRVFYKRSKNFEVILT
jgi:hypothetical protein